LPGKLVVCPTPIGNLEDITLRVRRALYEADVIACEDTRRTGLLLERLEIQALRLVSYHEGNEAERARELAQRIERGDNVALVSDAGTPAISDPGFRLIRACIDRDRTGELERVLQSTETLIAFESPRRLPESLRALAQLAPDRPAVVCRELTKLHEEVVRGTLGELSRRFREEARGEIVVVIGPAAERGTADIGFATDALRGLIRAGARPRAAASVVSALTGVPANDLYKGITGREPRR
jgi:16S rRNA (cytidine1402-2'-O)-methyltransferase